MAASLPSVGILAVSEAESIDALTQALAGAGCVRDRDYALFMPAPASDDRVLAANMKSILEANVALVVAQTKAACRVAVQATREVPVVLGAFNGDPAGEGIVESLERPGGNVTGTWYRGEAGAEQRYALLAELVPGVHKVGVLLNPRNACSRELATLAADLARRMGYEPVAVGAVDARGVEPAIARAKAEGVEAVVSVTGADIYAMRESLARACWRHRLPAVMGSIGFPALGGLAKLGPDIPVLWRQMAVAHVIPILEGRAPGMLPMIGLESFELELNLAAAAHLGITVSDALERRATRVLHHGITL